MPSTRTRTRKTTRPARHAKASARAPASPMPAVLYQATETPDVVTVPARTVVAIQNRGAPEGEVFQKSIAAIFGIAFTLKFARKKAGGKDFKIGPLEGRWWSEDPTRPFLETPRTEWPWELRMAIPDDVTPKELAAVVEAATTRKGGKLEGSPEARKVTLRSLPAARYGRVLHIGPYAEESRSFARIQEVLKAEGLNWSNAHLEVYLGDPRRSKPEKLKTALLLELA